MQTKRPFAPSFINKLDRYLLLNKPEAWSARTHLVVYYGILFMLLLAGIAFIVPDDPRTPSPASFWIGFVSLVSIIAMVGWVIYLLRFNVFKRYGQTGPAQRLMTFGLYFVCIGMFVLFCYVEPYVETVRAKASYTDQEIRNDINRLNVNICKLEYDSLDHTWERRTYLQDSLNAWYLDSVMKFDEDTNTGLVAGARKQEVGRERLKEIISSADSLLHPNDSIYIVLTAPQYIFLSPYKLENEGLLSNLELYHQVIQHYVPPANKQQIADESLAIKNKYVSQESHYENYDDRTPRERIEQHYAIREIDDSMNNILDRMHRWDARQLPAWIRTLLYTTLIVTMLVFAFRHTTAKTFFLTLLTAILLFILSSLILAFSRNVDERGIFACIVVYFIIALAISLATFFVEKRSAVTGIATNLSLLLLPFIPLVSVAWYYSDLRHANYAAWEKRDVQLEEQLLFMAEIGGFILLLLMIGTYFHKVYRRWYAAPES